MNRTSNTRLVYSILLLVGIGFAILFYRIESNGRKNLYEARINSMISVGPKCLTNHFPDIRLLEDAIYATPGPDIKHEIGGGYVVVTVHKNDTLKKFIESFRSDEEWNDINSNNIFNVDINYKKRKYELTNVTHNSKYPFPDIINGKNFKDYQVIFYDFGKGRYLSSNLLKDNHKEYYNWKHGYTRGIVENNENDYDIWLIIW